MVKLKNMKAWLITVLVVIIAVATIVSIQVYKDISSTNMVFGNANEEAIEVSVVNLITNPELYDGKLVRVKGVSHYAVERCGIYSTMDDYKNERNALWIDPDFEKLKTTYEALSNFNGKYVLIEGVFSSKDKGHFGMWPGSIIKISRFQKWK